MKSKVPVIERIKQISIYFRNSIHENSYIYPVTIKKLQLLFQQPLSIDQCSIYVIYNVRYTCSTFIHKQIESTFTQLKSGLPDKEGDERRKVFPIRLTTGAIKTGNEEGGRSSGNRLGRARMGQGRRFSFV